MGFWNSITNGFEEVGHFIGNVVHEGFNDIENIGKSAVNYIDDAKDQAFSTANHIIGSAKDLGDDVIKGGENIVGKATSVISTPLIIIAGGLALFLLSPNFSKTVEVGGQLGQQALKNPPPVMF